MRASHPELPLGGEGGSGSVSNRVKSGLYSVVTYKTARALELNRSGTRECTLF